MSPSGTKAISAAGVRFGDGEVVITELTGASPVPEPSTWAMMAAGFTALGFASLRRRKKPNAI